MQKEARADKRWILLLSRLWNAELPLFVIGLLACVVILLLTGVVVWSTFQKGLPGLNSAFSLDNYLDFLSHPFTLKSGLNTLIVGIGTVVICLLFAIPLAWLLQRTNIPGKNLFLTFLFLQVLLPGFLKAMGWIMLISPKIGIINLLIRNIIPFKAGPFSPYNLQTIVFLQGLTLTPVMFFLIAGAFMAVDPSFEEAAQVAGASLFKRLHKVTLPLLMPALGAAILYVFVIAVSMFEIAQLMGAPKQIWVFSTRMYEVLYPELGLPQYGAAAVYGVVLLVPTLVALYYYQKMLRASYRYATITGKGYKPKLVDLGQWKWVGLVFISIYFLLDIFIPFLSILWASLLPYLQVPSMAALASINMTAYVSAMRRLLDGGVLLNTILLVAFVAVGVLLISMVISWIVLRTRLPGRYFLDTVAMLPHALPRISLAFAMLFIGLALVRVVPFLHGSIIALIIVFIVSFISFGTRAINSSLIQIHQDLEDAVQTSGAPKSVGLRRVIMPILAPTLFYVIIWTALLSYREVTMPLFLQSPRNMVMATSIWQFWMAGDTAAAAALGVIMVMFMAIIISLLLYFNPQIKLRGL
jgi:iron(III) transport system permease protein